MLPEPAECLDSSHQSLAVWPQISGSAKSGEWAGLKEDMCVCGASGQCLVYRAHVREYGLHYGS